MSLAVFIRHTYKKRVLVFSVRVFVKEGREKNRSTDTTSLLGPSHISTFWSSNVSLQAAQDDDHAIRSDIAENPTLHTNVTALSFTCWDGG